VENRAMASTISQVRTMEHYSRKWLLGRNFGF
jgi:hypothetical protein